MWIKAMSERDSIFDIPNASRLHCKIAGLGRSVLKIKLYDTDNICEYTVTFSSVAYMRCPSKWKGAQFREANPKELNWFLTLVPDETKEKWRAKNLDPMEHYYDSYNVYIVDTDTLHPIVFVAEDARVNEEDNQ
jgi:hypothetical protein